ncbi:MAG TPA: biotin carboxylase N-terminal domain-containing protein [Acidimicrobiales bacterium]
MVAPSAEPGSVAGARPIHRLAVANRGEIARRVFRAARSLGIETVAVFADDDRDAPFVAEADRAVSLGDGPPAATYLDVANVIAAVVAAGADAVHPGYGFLSEDAGFADACLAAGLVWVGPPPAAIALMGHKARAKAAVAEAGVPVLASQVVPSGIDGDLAALTHLAEDVGYPLLVKASAGGGGRGMRLVDGPAGLADAVVAARREATAAFGSDEVFLERYVVGPRHVEVQVVADRHGNVVHLYDRDCSVQRRHQKVIEEAPASLVPDAVRRTMWDAAVAAAKAVAYEGVGTVEFVVKDDECAFLEMNTRLQVEHGVTELVTGVDLVGLQLAVAAGRPLDPGLATPADWQEYTLARTGVPAPGQMTDGSAAAFTPFESGYDPGDVIDRTIMATRSAVFPVHGLFPGL